MLEPVEWKASFAEGGTDPFVPTLLRLMDQLAREGSRPPPPPQPQQQGYGGAAAPTAPAIPVAHAVEVGVGGWGACMPAWHVKPTNGFVDVDLSLLYSILFVHSTQSGAYVDPADPSRVLVSHGQGQGPPPPMVRTHCC